ncbi:sugar transporter [Penicillium cf. viridicatum]|uniref:Sugar transporter n=1 Tax=Penicillium cf. viridicatum TaxID=2972119 RepID=A0A9W9JGV1_9EURO|nr:sugar transporter [Penicillium cf. viridicatum]
MISGFLQLWNLIFAVTAAFSVDRVSRRLIFIVLCLGMLVSIALISALSGAFATTGIKAIGTAVEPFIFIFSGFLDITFTPLLYAYICEIWPHNLRAPCSLLQHFRQAHRSQVDRMAVLLSYLLFTIFLFYPETKGHSLEEMSMVFDGSNDAVIVDSSTVHSIAIRRASAGTKNTVHLNKDSYLLQDGLTRFALISLPLSTIDPYHPACFSLC